MHLGLLPAPQITIFFAILGLSLLVASLDFVKRRARNRSLARRTIQRVALEPASDPIPDEPVKPAVVAKNVNVAAESPTVARIDRLARLPGADRTVMPRLAFGGILPLPMPTPRLPKRGTWLNTPVSWWQPGT